MEWVVVTARADSSLEALTTAREQAFPPVLEECPGAVAVDALPKASAASAATDAWGAWDKLVPVGVLEEDQPEPSALALPVVLWGQVKTVLQELLLALAAWEVALVRALVALFQVNHSVELAAPLDFRAWTVASLLLLALFQPLETPQALQAA